MIIGDLYPKWSEASLIFEISGKTMIASDGTVRLGRGAEEIAAWLVDDLRDTASAKSWLERILTIKNGVENEGYLGTGNAHSIGVKDGLVYLECSYVDELKVALTIDQMIAVLNSYIVFSKKKRRDINNPPASFLVEFELEGEAAWEKYSNLGGMLGWTKEDVKKNNAKLKKSKSNEKLMNISGRKSEL